MARKTTEVVLLMKVLKPTSLNVEVSSDGRLVPLAINWDGFVGFIPVFEDRESARKFAEEQGWVDSDIWDAWLLENNTTSTSNNEED